MPMRRTQIIGLLLWRGGLMFTGAWVAFIAARQFIRLVEVPAQVEIGLGLVLTGALLVLVSLILERAADVRREGDIKQ